MLYTISNVIIVPLSIFVGYFCDKYNIWKQLIIFTVIGLIINIILILNTDQIGIFQDVGFAGMNVIANGYYLYVSTYIIDVNYYSGIEHYIDK